MTKKIREMYARIEAIKAEMRSVDELIVKENRCLTEEEKTQVANLRAEMDHLSLEIFKLKNPQTSPEEKRATREEVADKVFRALASNTGVPQEFEYLRSEENPLALRIPAGEIINQRDGELMTASDVTAVVPLTIKEIVQPLEQGLIMSKVGTRIQYGIVGAWNFPVVAGVEASWAGENDVIADSEIDITAITPTPQRLSISVPVSNRAIHQSNGVVRQIVLTQIYKSLERALNHAMFNKTRVNNNAPKGVWVDVPAARQKTCTAWTYAAVNELRAAVEATGVERNGMCFVCNSATYYALAGTSKDNGSGRFIIEEGRIDGVPVFVTEYMAANTLGYGMFGYELVGFFGDAFLSVDATSKEVAKANMTYFVLNVDVDMKPLRQEAFGYLTKTA